jgi:hypothetical protein
LGSTSAKAALALMMETDDIGKQHESIGEQLSAQVRTCGGGAVRTETRIFVRLGRQGWLSWRLGWKVGEP